MSAPVPMNMNSLPVREIISAGWVKDQTKERMEIQARNNYIDNGTLCCPSVLSGILSICCFPMWLFSCHQVNEREAISILNWGKYKGTIGTPGLYIMNPFGTTVRDVSTAIQSMELPKLKVIDLNGNPLIVSGVVTFQVFDARLATINIQNWKSFLYTQAEVVLKQICAAHPYESQVVSLQLKVAQILSNQDSLKSETGKVRHEFKSLLQNKMDAAGIYILNFEFRELSYAPEVAGPMLVRQQAEALLGARKIVVEGAVSIASDAIHHLRESNIEFTPTEASRLVSNLVVTICSESKISPVIPF